MTRLIIMTMVLAGCSGPPGSLSLDPSFTEYEVAAIGDARNQWCEKTGWCPYFVTDGEYHIKRDDTMPYDPAPYAENVSGITHRDSRTVVLNAKKFNASPDMVWIIAAHELGHVYGLEDDRERGHEDCTMFWIHEEPEYQLKLAPGQP